MNIETLAAKYSAIPSHWRLSTLGESLTAIIGGGTPSRDNPSFWGGDIPWLTVKDMRGRRPTDAQEHITQQAVKESATNIIPPDTVITATRVGLGKVVRVPFAAAINQDLKALVVGPDLDKSYLEYWLVSIATFLESIGSGTTVKGIRLETLRQLPIPLAPLQEQREIVAELEKQFSRLDEAVANLQRVKANLKRYKASVLKAAVEGRLVETEATLAHREGRTYETGEQLLQRMLEERREKWTERGKYKEATPPVDTGVLHVPEGWVIGSAEQVCSSVRDGTHDTPDYVVIGVPLITSKNLDEHGIDFENVKCISEKDHVEISKRSAVSVGDILFAMIGTIGNPCEVKTEARFSIKNVALFKANGECLNPTYFCYWLQSAPLNKWLEPRLKGTTQKFAPLGLLRELPTVLPPCAEQFRIVAEVDRHLSIVREVETEVDANLKRAHALRQATLAKAFSAN